MQQQRNSPSRGMDPTEYESYLCFFTEINLLKFSTGIPTSSYPAQ